jgi:ATP synthase mitochondrial F1 complex assembly factor 2
MDIQTSLVARALDALAGEKTRTDVRASLLQYLETDTIWLVNPLPLTCFRRLHRPCSFHQNDPPVLVALQSKHWDPLLNWARSTFGVKIHTFNSVLMNAQPPETKQKFDEVLTKFDHWEMAGTA